ncbi:MAG: trehalose-phosphatase [Frankiales bacterium]|nr:trehalose-phosphatase [Frankiales bacterium]
MQPEVRAQLDDLTRELDAALLAVDFDGTLAPIVRDPQASRPVDGVIATLAELAGRGTRIAVVTGRDALTVVRLGGLAAIPGVLVSGLHGAETWFGGELHTQPEPPGIDALRTELPPLLAAVDPAVWLEDKRLSLVVHTRRTADPDARLAELMEPVSLLAEGHELEAHAGKQVIEIRIPQISKGDAVAALLDADVRAALFAGDDLGDLPAFAAIKTWSMRTRRPGVCVAVGEEAEVRAAADIQLADPVEFAELLTWLARS